jgi:hypothetical protein
MIAANYRAEWGTNGLDTCTNVGKKLFKKYPVLSK